MSLRTDATTGFNSQSRQESPYGVLQKLLNAVAMAWVGAAIDTTTISLCKSRRRGCSAWPLHAKAMLRNWMKSSFVPRKGSDRDSPIRDFPSTLLYRSALQKNSLLGALLHIIYLGVTPLSPAAGKSRNDAPSAGSSHCCG